MFWKFRPKCDPYVTPFWTVRRRFLPLFRKIGGLELAFSRSERLGQFPCRAPKDRIGSRAMATPPAGGNRPGVGRVISATKPGPSPAMTPTKVRIQLTVKLGI